MLHNLVEFFPSESGLSNNQKGAPFGWLISAMGIAAAIIGIPKDAQATMCCKEACAYVGGQAVAWNDYHFNCNEPPTCDCP